MPTRRNPPFPRSRVRGDWGAFLLLLTFFVLPARLPLAVAQIGGVPRLRQPPLVRITCAFAPLTATRRSHLRSLDVRVKQKKWRLHIREIKALTATTHQGWGLLNDLFPPWLRLTGPDDLLSPLQHDEIAGQPLVLEGRLYVGDHMLYLTAVERLE